MPDVFISYAREDGPIAREITEMLKAEDYSVFDDSAMAAGADFSTITEKALTNSKAVVVLLSRNSNRSKLVDIQLRDALQRGQVIIPVLLDEEAKSNWVWPLVSDRKAIEINSPARIQEVVSEVNRAVGDVHERLYAPATRNASAAAPAAEATSRSGSHALRFTLFLVAVFLSAIAGALGMWLLK